MRVLFVCKHNRFRSKAAEALFNLHISEYETQSRGIKQDLPYVAESVKKILLEFGVNEVDNTPRMIDNEILNWADKIIIAADNVSPELFKGKDVEVWKIQDCDQSEVDCIRLRIEDIDNRVKNLIKRLGKHKS